MYLPSLRWIAEAAQCCRVVLCFCVVLLLQNLVCSLASDRSWKFVFPVNVVFGGLSWPPVVGCRLLCFDVLCPREGNPCPHTVHFQPVFLIFALSFPPRSFFCGFVLLFYPSLLDYLLVCVIFVTSVGSSVLIYPLLNKCFIVHWASLLL